MKVTAKATGQNIDRTEVRRQNAAFLNKSPAEVGQWVEANVNDLASAKDLLKRLAMAVTWLMRQ